MGIVYNCKMCMSIKFLAKQAKTALPGAIRSRECRFLQFLYWPAAFAGNGGLAQSTAITWRIYLLGAVYPRTADAVVFAALKADGIDGAATYAGTALSAVIINSAVGTGICGKLKIYDDAGKAACHTLFRDNALGKAKGAQAAGIGCMLF